MAEIDFRTLGAPDIRIADLSLWIRRREFPDATDYWDGNWLDTTARYRCPGADVWTVGPFLRTTELQGFLTACAELHRSLSGEACLDCIEPTLRVTLTGDSLGHISVFVSLRPEHLTQRHEFKDEIDQTFLPDIMTACRNVLERFPIVGALGK